MAFVSSVAGWFRAKVRGRARPGQAPTRSLPRGLCLTLEISSQVHRVPGVVSVELDALPVPLSTARFPVDHTPQQVSHPSKAECPRKN